MSTPSPHRSNQSAASLPADTRSVTAQQWKWSALAGMASYLDAGSIVALGAGMALFRQFFNLSDTAVGIFAAIGPNAIGCAIGAFIGGWLGDKLGRKRIYQYDLLVYAAGVLLIACAVNTSMLFIGTFIVGLAVGADVPTSLALVGEFAPDKARAKLLGFTQVAWCLGPAVVLWLALFLTSLNHPIHQPGTPVDPAISYGDPSKPFIGLLGVRILFLHLFVVALVTWALRRGLAESTRWMTASASVKKVRALFSGPNLRGMVWTGTIYLFWNIAAGTAGIFNPYFIETLHAGSPAASAGLASLPFVCTMIVTLFIFMPFSDRSFRTRKWLWGIGSVVQIVAYGLFLFAPFTITTVLFNVLLFGSGAALAGEAFYKVFSQELFPTMQRGTAQGVTFGVARTLLGVWSFLVPILLGERDIKVVAACLTVFLMISGGVGFFWMPDTAGKSLEQIEAERHET